jgi:NADPH-dependent glutamate synthase beta subunit-like oxidoreductase
VSLIRSGEYDKAFSLVLETTPLAGSLGRACYAPCEAQCTRGSLEGPVPIRRLGAAAVHLACLEANDQMPAYAWEVAEAEAEGVTVVGGWGVAGFYGGPAGHAPQDGQRDARQLGRVVLKKCLLVFDAARRFSPRYAEDVTDECACDLAIVAIGMGADTAAFPALAPNGARTLQADPVTSRTALPGVFAAGTW